MLEIVLATRNAHKARELRGLLRVRGIRWRTLAEFPRGGRAARETGRTFEANARAKALDAARATGCWALADDSGLEVDALAGSPGVRSARYAGPGADDAANNAKLLRALTGVPKRRRGAHYRCVLALAAPTGRVIVAHGTWQGRIAAAPAGRNGFGYDPLFLVPRLGRTVGQLPSRVKQRLSHRAAAARRLRRALTRLLRAGR
jgi:XTP/dITP diphosphohydrolase